MNYTAYFKSLSDETRLRLFGLLLYNELNVNELVTILSMGQPRISRHLKILSESSLISSRRDGLWIYYNANIANGNKHFIQFIKDIVGANEIFQKDRDRAVEIINERKKRTKRFFNSIAGDWDSLKREILGNIDFSKFIIENTKPKHTVADLGCGTGDLLFSLQGHVLKLIGVDNSPKMVEIARSRLNSSITETDLRLGELEHLPLSNGEADIAVLNMTLHHLSNPLKAIVEARRILRKQGKIIIFELAKHDNESMRNRYGDIWLGFDKKRIEGWLKKSRFENRSNHTVPLSQDLTAYVFISLKK